MDFHTGTGPWRTVSNHDFISMTELDKSNGKTRLLKQVMNNSFTGESTFVNVTNPEILK